MATAGKTTAEFDFTKFRILSLIGLGFSALLIHHDVLIIHNLLRGPSACSISALFNCDVVARSPFSRVFGIPVACFGFVYYLVLAGVAFGPSASASGGARRNFICFASAVALLPTLFLFSMSAFVIRAFCPYCAVLYLTNLLMFLAVWRDSAVAGMSLAQAFRGGIAALGDFLQSAFRSGADSRFARVCLAAVLFATLATYASIDVILRIESKGQHVVPANQSTRVEAVLQAWRSSQPRELALDLFADDLRRDFVYGRIDAPITLIEFGDFECPSCRFAAPPVKELLLAHPDDVRFIFHNFPLDSECNTAVLVHMHPLACSAARLLRCAGSFGADFYWSAQQALFEGQELTQERIQSIPLELGLPEEAYATCLESQEMRLKIASEVRQGIALEVKSTPSFFVYANKRLVKIPQFDLLRPALEAIRDELLQEAH